MILAHVGGVPVEEMLPALLAIGILGLRVAVYSLKRWSADLFQLRRGSAAHPARKPAP